MLLFQLRPDEVARGILMPLVRQIESFVGEQPEVVEDVAQLPPQLIAGFGGDKLDPTPAVLKGTIFQGKSGVSVKDGLSLPGFGFLLMTKDADGWTIDVHDVHGKVERTCLFHSGRLDCPAKD